ncbi:MAG: hypothetical protein MPW14_14445 [Candidatus Manganitrophus sp.]|nr:MAG: hypothetical protein MPW14_14445 [Candidatus Manganitrophus sp.]
MVIITMRSDSSTASSTSCVTIITVAPDFGHDPQQLVLQIPAGQRVERAEGLVHQQHLRPHGQRPGDADALLHAAGDLGRTLLRRLRQADQVQRAMAATRAFCSLRLICRKPASTASGTLSSAGQPRQQRVVLEHHAAVGAGPVNLVPLQDNDAQVGSV